MCAYIHLSSQPFLKKTFSLSMTRFLNLFSISLFSKLSSYLLFTMPPRKTAQSKRKSQTNSESKEHTISNSQTSEGSDGGDLAILLSQLQGAVAKKQKSSKKALMVQSTDEAARWTLRLEQTYAERKKAHQILCDESFAQLEKDQEEVTDSIEKLVQLEIQFKEFCDHLKIEQVNSARVRNSTVHGYIINLQETLLAEKKLGS